MKHKIRIYDATPAMADVLSGAVARPEAHVGGHWWHWAVKTLAAQRALEHLAIDISPEAPWKQEGEWDCRPWIEPGHEANGMANQFDGAVDAVRDALGEPLAGVFYCQKSRLDTKTVEHVRSHPTFIAVNVDGTRAASLQVIEPQNYE